jgi:hypothetical protein
MVIDTKTRTKLIALFEGVDYRQIVADRADCHPNTVANVLHHGTDNPKVELELLVLAQEVQTRKDEEEQIRKKARAIAKQL